MEYLFHSIYECPNCEKHAPSSAYFFIPSEKDEYYKSNSGKIIRYIFEKKNKKNYFEYEENTFKNFQKFFKTKTLILPKYWEDSDTRRFLQACYFDIEKTYEKIKSSINYKIPNLPLSSYEKILSSRFLYMHGLDINYCPILVCNVKIFMDIIDKYPIENFICSIDKIISYLMAHFFIPGQIENWVVITDLKDVSIWDPPLKLLKIFEFLQTKYIFRLKYLYIYNMDTILNFCFNIIKNLIDERTSNKIRFIRNQNDINDIVLTNIHSSQIERKYGGDANNLINDLEFPFILPSNEYQIQENRKEIISEEEYIKRFKNNEICVLSPYLKYKIKLSEISDKKPVIYEGIEFYEVQSFQSSRKSNFEKDGYFTIHEVKPDENENNNIKNENNTIINDNHFKNKNMINTNNNITHNYNNSMNDILFIDNFIKNKDNIENISYSQIKNESSENRETSSLNLTCNKFKEINKKYLNFNNKCDSSNETMNILVEKENKNKDCCKEECIIM